MRKPIYSPPDAFALSPFLSLLPVKGSVRNLSALTNSLYARYEKVKVQLADAQAGTDKRRYAAEEAMLKQVLDWLASQMEGGR